MKYLNVFEVIITNFLKLMTNTKPERTLRIINI